MFCFLMLRQWKHLRDQSRRKLRHDVSMYDNAACSPHCINANNARKCNRGRKERLSILILFFPPWFDLLVQVVSPGLIDTPMFAQEGAERDEFFAKLTSSHLIPRRGRPEEVAGAKYRVQLYGARDKPCNCWESRALVLMRFVCGNLQMVSCSRWRMVSSPGRPSMSTVAGSCAIEHYRPAKWPATKREGTRVTLCHRNCDVR